MKTTDEIIQNSINAAKAQIEAVRAEAHDYYRRSQALEGMDDEMTAYLIDCMKQRDALADEMCRVLANLRLVAQCRLYEKNATLNMTEIY